MKKILFVNEASYLATGYSVYGYELLSRLHKTGKYEIAELAAYGEDGDYRANNIPWKFYPNMPNSQNAAEYKQYQSRLGNSFGEWRFEKTCLDFQPHIVCDIRDWWFCEYEDRSPFRPYYKWVVMPTVDSAPQDEQWMASYLQADAILAYSPFGEKTLREESSGLVKFHKVASPGANLEDFPLVVDKATAKEQIGLPKDILLVGTVMRNQERKLYPDLLEAFAEFLQVVDDDLSKKTFMYVHTGFPDVGWKIPYFLKRFKLTSKVLFTYTCHNCNATYPSFYQDARAVCKYCHQYTATLPSVQHSVDRAALGKIMGLFDVYVQYAVCEGFGMPLVEAAATGAICLAVDYSAMSDIINTINGYPIKVQRMFYEPKTHSQRALPLNEDLVHRLHTILVAPTAWLEEKRKKTRKLVEENYSWDKTAKVWEECLDNIEVLPPERSWRGPSRITTPTNAMPANLSSDELVRWAIVNIAGRPELLNSYIALRLSRDLNWGASQTGNAGMYFNEASYPGMEARWLPFGKDDVIQEMYRACEQKNVWERERLKLT